MAKQHLGNVVNQLKVELRSDEFTKTARKMLKTNLVPLAERMITQHKSEMAEKTRKMLTELVPVAVNAALLPFKTAEEDHKEKNKIIDEVLDSITTTFDAESILFSDDVAKMHIKSELNKRIGSIRSSEDKVA